MVRRREPWLDLADPVQRRAFFALHKGLPRQGPGNRASTQRAFQRLSTSPTPKILDVGCGPGKQTLDLARCCPGATIVGCDLDLGFLKTLHASAVQENCCVSAVCADMRSLPFVPGGFDVVWCEGAAYIMGLANALNDWSRLLKPGGYLAFTEPTWLRADAPAKIKRWWSGAYADMRSVAECRELVRRCGYVLVTDFTLPAAAWWDDYYNPLQERISAVGEDLVAAAADPEQAEKIQQVCRYSQEEIDNYRAYQDCYGYTFFVLCKSA